MNLSTHPAPIVQPVTRVLPHIHGRLSYEVFPSLLHLQSPPLPRIVTAFEVLIHTLSFEHPKEALDER